MAGLTLRAVLVAVSLGAVVGGVLWRRPERQAAWWLVVGGLAASFAGDLAVLYSGATGTGGALAFDLWASGVGGVLLIAGVASAASTGRDVGGILDALAVGIAAGLAFWSVVISTAAESWVGSGEEASGAVRALVYFAALALLVRARTRAPADRRVPFVLAALALVTATVAFVGGVLGDVGGVASYTGPRAAFGAIANLLVGAAALHPQMTAFTARFDPPVERLTPLRTMVLAATLVAPAGVLLAAADGMEVSSAAVAVSWIVLTPLVLGRMYLLGRGLDRARHTAEVAHARIEAILEHTPDVVLLVQRDDDRWVTRFASPGARVLLGEDAGHPDSDLGSGLPADTRNLLQDTVAVAAVGSGAPADQDVELPDGRWVHLRASRYRDRSGADEGVVLVVGDVTRRKRREQELADAASTDPLTGLYNRRGVAQVLGSLPDDAGLIVCDLDGFRPVNNTFGHAAGDDVLVEVARRLQAAVRQQDTVARLGGDEFLLVCRGDDSAIEAVATRVVDDLAKPIAVGDVEVTIGCSAGLARPGRHGSRPDETLEAADQALYAAKRAGKGRFLWSSA